MMDADDNDPGSHESESRGCLLIVACYADLAAAIRPVAAEAARRIMMSPALGDFIELRYASLGPRPREDHERQFAVARIAAAVSRPAAAAAQTYFAIVTIDRSAATVGRVLADCAESPVISALPLRRRGLALIDDRTPAGEPASTSPAAEVLIPTEGRWTQRTLTDALRHYAEKLLLDFGTGYQPGLTPQQLEMLRADVGSELASQQAETADTDRELDLLPDEQMPDGTEPAADMPSQEESAPDQPGPVPVLGRPATPPAVTSELRVTGSERATILPEPPLKSPIHPADGTPALLTNSQPPGSALLFLITIGGPSSRGRMTWKRAQSLLIELDGQLARRPGPAWKVRFTPDPSRIRESTLRDAGRLRRRDFRQTSANLDFAQSLAAIRTMLNRDLAAFGRSKNTVEAATVVLFAIEPPLADAVTTREYEQLADLARVIWVVPEAMIDLLSSAFAAGSRIFGDYPGVGEEVINLLETAMASSSTPPTGTIAPGS